jgi:PAS domain S-box-containing protein
VYRTGPDHALIFANRAYLSLSGYKSLEELQLTPRETLYANPNDRARLLSLLAANGGFHNEEIEYIDRHGKRWWGLTNSVAIRDPISSELLYHVGSVKDISKRKIAEGELRKLNATLEKRVEERTAELAASEARLTVDNLERKRREKVQQATFQISEAVHTAQGLDNLYRQIHGIVNGLMPARNFYISLHDPVRQMLDFAYWVDEKDECPKAIRQHAGLTGHVLRTARPFLASRKNTVHKEPGSPAIIQDGPAEIPYVEHGTPPAQWLGAPMLTQGNAVGVLEVFDYSNENAYGDEEQQLLSFIAAQTALAIERKHAEQALRESEEKFRALFQASSAGVMLHDETRFLEVNPAILRILGYERAQDLIGKSPAAISPPTQPGGESSTEAAQKHIADCITNGSTRFEWMAQKADGSDVPLEVILTRVEWGGKQIIQAVVNDILERKQAEAELLKSLAREKELSALKSSFVSMVSHEFRTPLGIIMSSAEILDSYLEKLDTEERGSHLDSIRKNSRRMAELMEEVLVLSRFDAGKMDFTPACLDLSAFFRRVTDEILSATNRISPVNLALAASVGIANADERLLRHIFTNLLSNAIKYSPPGSEAELNVRVENAEIICEVKDYGIGIPETDRQWLFHAFHRGQNVGQRHGTGLGLVIVKRCIELHGGTISLDSKVGEGSAVTVRLPWNPCT